MEVGVASRYRWDSAMHCIGVNNFNASISSIPVSLLFFPWIRLTIEHSYIYIYIHSSGAVWESKWTSWAVRPNEPSGFRGRKDLLNHASALVCLSLICQPTSEDIKHPFTSPPRPHSSGAVWESRWPSRAVRPSEPSGFRGRKAILNHASALVSACP